MQKIVLDYNPYKMETVMIVDGRNVLDCKDYSRFAEFIRNHTPLQSWIEPIAYNDWPGLLNGLCDPSCSDSVELTFHGRTIDFEDLRNACIVQNNVREYPVELVFNFEETRSDSRLAQGIDAVMKELLSERFAALVADRPQNAALQTKFQTLRQDYENATSKEFRVVFAGIYSSGKSTIINALIRQDILPTSDDTCTAKICRVKHDRSLGTNFALVCYDVAGKVVVQREVFADSAKCKERLLEIVPLGQTESTPPEVATIEIQMNLSHLYPSKSYENKFNLVLVDTPGSNSSKTKSSGETTNAHIRLTLDAITTSDKEMVVLCADGQDYEDESIGILLKAILDESQKEASRFNDRFLFVLNKCDNKKYKGGESAEDAKQQFANYLMNAGRWGYDDSEGNEVDFIPKIFMLSAYPALAVIKGVPTTDSSSEDMDDETLNLLLGYESFQKNVVQFKRKNYFLSQLCDIPQYQKEKFMREFANADTVRAVEIQCGVLCLQAAIQDYIARYAYPIKVKSLISVFKSLLEDVTEFTSLTEQKLKERIAVLGEKEGEREGVRRRKESDAQRKENTEQLKNDADILKSDILATSFDFSQFTRIKMAFNSCIESDPNIRKIRQSSGATFTYDEKESIINAMLVTHKRAWSTASSCFQELIAAYNLLLKGKLEHIKKIRDEAARYGLLSNGNYKAKIGYEEKLDDLALDIDHIRSDIENNKREGHYVISMNPIKYETYEWWQWGKKIKKFFAKDYTKEWVGDRYDLSLLLKELTSMNASFEKRCDSAISTYRTDLEDIKNRMNDLIDGLLTLIEQIDADINEQEAKLVALGEDIGINRQAQEELTLTLTWLTTLNDRIKGV